MTAHFDRRLLLKTGMFGLGALGLQGGALAAMQAALTRGFSHGVASGEPSQNSVLLWTRFVSDLTETKLRAWLTVRRIDPGRSSLIGSVRQSCTACALRCSGTRQRMWLGDSNAGTVSVMAWVGRG